MLHKQSLQQYTSTSRELSSCESQGAPRAFRQCEQRDTQPHEYRVVLVRNATNGAEEQRLPAHNACHSRAVLVHPPGGGNDDKKMQAVILEHIGAIFCVFISLEQRICLGANWRIWHKNGSLVMMGAEHGRSPRSASLAVSCDKENAVLCALKKRKAWLKLVRAQRMAMRHPRMAMRHPSCFSAVNL